MSKSVFKISLIFCLAATAIFIGIYLDEFTDIVFSTIFTGLFQTEAGSVFNNYECLFGISKLIQKLQLFFTNYNMYGLVLTIINSYCIYKIIVLLAELTILKTRNVIVLFIFLNITGLLLHDFIFIQFTKTAIFCNFIGCYLLFFDAKKTKTAITLIILGMLLRNETFWLVIIVTFGLIFILKRQLVIEHLKNKKIIWLSIVCIGITISILNKKTYNANDKRYENFRTYKYTILDFTQKNNDSLFLNHKDSVKLNALQHAFFIDTDSLLSINTFHSLSINQHERFDFTTFFKTIIYKQNLERAYQNINKLFTYNKPNYLLWLSLVVILWIFYLQAKEYARIKKMGLALGFLCIIIVAITIYIKMENRVFSPLLFILLFYFIQFYDVTIFEKKRKIIWIAILFVFISQLYFSLECYYKFQHRKNLYQQSEIFIKNWNKTNSDKILVPDLFSWEIFFSKSLTNTSETKKIKLFSVDEGYLSMMQNHLDYMQNLMNSNHFKDYIQYLITNKENVYFLSSEQRIKLLKEYTKEIYEIDLNFINSKQNAVIDEQGTSDRLQLYLFQLQNDISN